MVLLALVSTGGVVTDASFEGAPGSAATAGSVTSTANLSHSLSLCVCVCGDMASSIMHVILIHEACARCAVDECTVSMC